MVSEWLKATDDVIQFITQHTQWSIGAVRARVNKWRAPEVVVQQLVPWLTGVHHIGIAQNRSSVNEEKEKKRENEKNRIRFAIVRLY
jgi:hypothetical protein